MGEGLGDSEEKQAYAHAGAEQHRKPANIAVIRLRIVGP